MVVECRGKRYHRKQRAAFKKLCRFPLEENKIPYKRVRNQTRKVIASGMRKEAEKELNNLCQNSNSAFCFLKRMQKEKILKE